VASGHGKIAAMPYVNDWRSQAGTSMKTGIYWSKAMAGIDFKYGIIYNDALRPKWWKHPVKWWRFKQPIIADFDLDDPGVEGAFEITFGEPEQSEQ
jgi:hypothetical protein